jgi:hypothetical protein
MPACQRRHDFKRCYSRWLLHCAQQEAVNGIRTKNENAETFHEQRDHTTTITPHFQTEGDMYRLSAAGGAPRTHCDDGSHPDGHPGLQHQLDCVSAGKDR